MTLMTVPPNTWTGNTVNIVKLGNIANQDHTCSCHQKTLTLIILILLQIAKIIKINIQPPNVWLLEMCEHCWLTRTHPLSPWHRIHGQKTCQLHQLSALTYQAASNARPWLLVKHSWSYHFWGCKAKLDSDLGLVEVTLVTLFFLDSRVGKGDMLFDILLASQLMPSNFPPHHDRVAIGQKLYTKALCRLHGSSAQPLASEQCWHSGTTKTYQLTYHKMSRISHISMIWTLDSQDSKSINVHRPQALMMDHVNHVLIFWHMLPPIVTLTSFHDSRFKGTGVLQVSRRLGNLARLSSQITGFTFSASFFAFCFALKLAQLDFPLLFFLLSPSSWKAASLSCA